MIPMQITRVEPFPMPAAVMVLAQCCTMKVPAISAIVACGTNHCGSSAYGSSCRARVKACGAYARVVLRGEAAGRGRASQHGSQHIARMGERK
jgi:hypothetical protein